MIGTLIVGALAFGAGYVVGDKKASIVYEDIVANLKADLAYLRLRGKPTCGGTGPNSSVGSTGATGPTGSASPPVNKP